MALKYQKEVDAFKARLKELLETRPLTSDLSLEQVMSVIRWQEIMIEEDALDGFLQAIGLIDFESIQSDKSYDTWGTDDYDSSIELKGCTEGVEVDRDQWLAIHALGFQRMWICYRDGSEKYYFWDMDKYDVWQADGTAKFSKLAKKS